jgi:peptidoglycan/xylan/chitin deacetylase (PgdA/CDA1 family)
MPWKDGYTISDEIAVADAAIAWPEGARVAALITLDLSMASGPEGISARDLEGSVAQFGLGDGLEGVLRVLARHGRRATIAVPAALAAIRPEIIRALRDAGHEIAAQGIRHEDMAALPLAEEQARIRRAAEILEGVTGQRPRGWYSLPRPSDPFAGGTISPNTMALLRAEGFRWFGNGQADDAPHWWVSDAATGAAILALPYYYHFDDQWFCMFPAKGTGLENPDMLHRNWRGEFAAQYRRGRCFHMVIHPQHSGFAHRLKMLDDFLGWIGDHPGVWNPTGSECAAHWDVALPRAEHLRLRPSIWRDYPGSLS